MEKDKTSQFSLKNVPLPSCIVDEEGKIIETNSLISEVFVYDGVKDASFFALTGVKAEELFAKADSQEYAMVKRNDKSFKIVTSSLEDQDGKKLLAAFIDITHLEELKNKYNSTWLSVIIVNIDNYDELLQENSEKEVSALRTDIDKLVRDWGEKLEASVNKVGKNQYILFAEQAKVEPTIEAKFPILDEARKIETSSDFPISLSIGVGQRGNSIAATEEYAESAVELALGRGGDQAVVKQGGNVQYFGGVLQSVEKNNKGKSRIIVHALKRLIKNADRVFIMGHRNPDMDAFGSALGLHKLCKMESKEAYIIVNSFGDNLREIYRAAVESENYKIINTEKALELVTKDSLVIVLDTNRLSLVECPEILDCTDNVAIVDHHRRAEDYIAKAKLAYVESYASSTAELISEMLEYVVPKKTLNKFEAEALLAGMTIDTNRFATKTGVRTFEAASWLRRAGADTTEVKKYFQTSLEDFQVKAKCVAGAEFYDKEIAISICEGQHEDAQVLVSQVADELLNIKGIKASFVMGCDKNGKTVLSARSLGEINVQLVAERFGGGGHLTTAGAQSYESPEVIKEKLLEIIGESKEE
ncbi:MAG: DHH family phosphoesterase [Clostridia bacterium]|nr:DHH family phosphoesterase [Clostridia bacterium]